MPRSLSDFHVGEPFGRYDLLLPVAEGGMSRVWAARLRGTRGFQKVVALKTLLANGEGGQVLEQMLLDEARHAAAIQHANVAQYLDVGEHDGVLFLVMEWLDGESLSRLLKNARRADGIPLRVAVEIIAQALKGLHAAHELRDEHQRPLGLVHCDISPQNVMLTSSGTVKLIDFGVARATRGAAASGGLVTGKLSFMAPEQIRGRGFDRRADLFSLGIVLYLLVTGRHPFAAPTPREIMQQIRVGAPVRPPSQLMPGSPPALDRVIARALAHSPDDRFATAAEMLSALVQAVPDRAEEPELAAFVERVCSQELEGKRRDIAHALARTPNDSQEYLVSAAPASSRRLPLSETSPHSTTLPATVVTQPVPLPDPAPRKAKTRALIPGLFVAAACAGFFASQLDQVDRWFGGEAGQHAVPAARPLAGPERAAIPAVETRPSSEAERAVPSPSGSAASVDVAAAASAPASHVGAAPARSPARGAGARRAPVTRRAAPLAAPSPSAKSASPPAAPRRPAAKPERESKNIDRYGI